MATQKSSSKRRRKKASAKKATKKTTSAQTRAAKANSASLSEWLTTFHENAKAVMAAGEPVGACLVTDPHTGTESCLLVDQNTCKALKGSFIGGPCGGG